MTRAVLRKDLAVLWLSPIPWAVGALFHVVLSLLFVNEIAARRQALIQPIFPIAGFLLVALVPLLTMRAFADEARTGTLDLLLAVPVKVRSLVVGKWLATWVTVLLVTAPAGLLYGLVSMYGDPDSGPALTGAIGLVLFSAALCALGVLASAVVSSQPVAAALALFTTLLVWFAHVGSERLPVGGVLAHFSVSERLQSFAGGALDSGDVAFFCVLTVAALVIASLVVDARRLR